jgi:DNA repair protein RecN (Recombination protein N)
MLTELRISNFGVIEQLTIKFHQGFTVLTGETGAGKSLLIDALALLIGGRASSDHIRSGAEEAHLEAVFSLARDHRLLENLRQNNLVEPFATELIVHRSLSRSGRNRNYLNANPIPLHILEMFGGALIEIHGQHDQQSLLSADTQRDALDAFGHLQGLRRGYETAYGAWRERRQQLDELRRQIGERRQREEYVRYQSQEIHEVAPTPGEDTTLAAERRKLSGAQRVRELAQQVYDGLYGAEGGVLHTLAAVTKAVQHLEAMEVGTESWTSLSAEATVQLRELASLVRDYREHIEDDSERLSRVERRLADLERIKKKYGGSLDAVLKHADTLQEELSSLDTATIRVADEERGVKERESQVHALAVRLSRKRCEVAKDFQDQVGRELTALMMHRTQFEVAVEKKPDEPLGSMEQDRVVFHLSTNPGESVRPLAQIASGGELSRVMLALKSVLAETDGVPILIFDEVDSGVGGAVAEVMGKRLRTLGTHHQVFCVTHLPQVASQAHRHCLVDKKMQQKRTVTQVRELGPEEREAEIARMLGGVTVTKHVRAAAAEMIGGAQRPTRADSEE